jgi:radical SAM protein with 4Fe4S-binding SPASM domain
MEGVAGVLKGVSTVLAGTIPTYTRKARHLDLLRRYATRKKLVNLFRAEMSLARGDVETRGFPYVYTIDTGNVCNLRCPLCPTGAGTLARPQKLMSHDTFRALLDKISPYAIEVILHNWGEPFLNPDILPIIRSAAATGVGTTLSSNLNLVHRGEDFLAEVVESGLDHLTVSLDGTTQDVYEVYRKGGQIDRVLGNLETLLRLRRARRSKTPVVEWQFLVMKHNEHQIPDARRLAKEIGVDRIRFTPAGLPFDDLSNVSLAEQWLPQSREFRNYDPETIRRRGYLYDEPCFYLYRGMTINPAGEVSPCCVVHHARSDFGNLLESDLADVWNNAHYRSSRALFSRRSVASGIDTICARCPLFKYEAGAAEPSRRIA